MKILWANRYCLLDTSSGASRSVREILELLSGLGHEVKVVGATIFDAPVGQTGLGDAATAIQKADKPIVNVKGGQLTHQLVKTKSTSSGDMTLTELNALYSLFRSNLESFRPDVVFHYGGNSFDMLIPSEAKRFGAVTAAYLANPNYMGSRWHDDVDLVFTDSRATANLYKENIDLDVIPVGKFIDPEFVVAEKREPEHVTFINPSVEKGAALVAQVALEMEKRRPEITFEVVQSRGDWSSFLTAVQSGKKKRKSLKNVMLTPNSRDMRPVYGRSKVLFAPSFWWESGARVLAEAMLNGIPAITTRNGGSLEMIGDAGVALTLPKEFHEKPYNKLIGKVAIIQICEIIERFYDDPQYYQLMSSRALKESIARHNRSSNIVTLEAALLSAINVKKKYNNLGLKEKKNLNTSIKPKKEVTRLSYANVDKGRFIRNFVYFWTGDDLTLPGMFAETVRKSYGPNAHITQISKNGDNKPETVDDIISYDLPDELMLARTIAFSKFRLNVAEPHAYYDVDTLVLRPVPMPMLSGRHGVLARDDDFVMNHNFPEYYPEFVSKKVKDIMPYIGGCYVTQNPQDLFGNVLEIYKKLSARFHRWYGDQYALAIDAGRRPDRYLQLHESIYLKTVHRSLTGYDALCLRDEGHTAVLHFKGKSVKGNQFEVFDSLFENKVKEDQK